MIADTKLFIGHSLNRDATKELVITFAQINSIKNIYFLSLNKYMHQNIT